MYTCIYVYFIYLVSICAGIKYLLEKKVLEKLNYFNHRDVYAFL